MREFSLSQVQVKKQEPRPFGSPPSDGNNNFQSMMVCPSGSRDGPEIHWALPARGSNPSLSLLILSTEAKAKAHACGMGWQQTCQALARSGLVAEYIVAADVTPG